jgi:hypothetical protein
VDYEFLDKLDPAIFKNLPPEVETHEPTVGDMGNIVKGVASKKG